MYGLTDNIVAGPAGQVTAAAAGSFMAGPAGSFTPAPAGHTPVYPVTAGMPPSGAGYVPIDTTPPHIPYAAASGGGVHMLGGSTQAPIPGPQASVPVSPVTGGGAGLGGGGGISYVSGGGGGLIAGGGGGGGGGLIAGGVGGGGGLIAGGAGGGAGGVGASTTGGGGVSASTNPGAVGGAGGGGGSVAAGSNTGVMPSSGSNPGAVGGGGGGSNSTVAYAGVGFPPMELRMGQAFTPATGSITTSPSTEGFTVTPGGRTIPSPVGYVHPPPASRFHAPQYSRVSRHPVHVETHQTTTESFQPYKASYVWHELEGKRPELTLTTDTLKASPYEPPHLLFSDERVGMATVDASVGAKGGLTVNENVSHTLHQDFSQTRNVEFANSTTNERNLVLDNSITRNVEQNFPEYRESVVNIIQSQVPAFTEPRLDLTATPLVLGGPVLARVA